MAEKVLQLFGIVLDVSVVRRRLCSVRRRWQQAQQAGRPVAHVRLAPQYRPAAELVGRLRLRLHRARRHSRHCGGGRLMSSRGRGRRRPHRRLSAGRRRQRAWTPSLAVRHGRLDGRRGRTRRSATIAIVPDGFPFDRTARLAVRLYIISEKQL